ncbi:MAG: cysteine desulfurase [Saprospiraceae bacterium]|nr:cysteine desulfurase [Saprospiraceae bacterium]
MNIYFDNASTTPILPAVIEHMTEVMREDYGNPSSIHKHGRKAKSIIENARKMVAKVINASISEVFFTSSATEANNMVIKNAVQDLGIQRIISSPTEHHCILHTINYLESQKKCYVQYVDVDEEGNPDYEQLEVLLNASQEKTLVSIMHGNNEIGTMTDIYKIGMLCKKYNALFHCDTVQTIGKYPVDVQANNISFLSGSGHKFHGPKGIGFVFISNANIILPYIHGGAQERNMRAGTENVAGISGLSLALEFNSNHMVSNRNKILNIRSVFKKRLETEIEDIRFNGRQHDLFMAHVLSVSFPPGPKAEMLVMNLDIAGISASSGSACSAGIEEDSHVLKAIGHPNERKTIRFSFSPFNTEEEVHYTIDKLKEMSEISALKM